MQRKLLQGLAVLAAVALLFTLVSCDDGSGGGSGSGGGGPVVDNTVYPVRDRATALALVGAIYQAIDSVDYNQLFNADDSNDTPRTLTFQSAVSGYVIANGVSYYSYLYGSQYYGGKTRNYTYKNAVLTFYNYQCQTSQYGDVELVSGSGVYDYRQKYGGQAGSTTVKLDTSAFTYTYNGKKYAGTVALERVRSQTDSSYTPRTTHKINYLYLDGALAIQDYTY